MSDSLSNADASLSPGGQTLLQRMISIARHRGTFALLDQMIVSGMNFLTVVLVGRYCGTEDLGLFSLGMSVVFFALGVQTSLVSLPYTVFSQQCDSDQSKAVRAGDSFTGGLLLITVITVLTLLTAGALQWIVTTESATAIGWALCLTLPLTLAREFARRYELAHVNSHGAFVLDSWIALLQLSALAGLAITGNLYSSRALAVIGLVAAAAAVPWFLLRRTRFQVRGTDTHATLREDWRFGRWLLVDHVVCFGQLYIMHWCLTLLEGTAATGVLAACLSIAALANPVLHGIGNYLSPRFAETVARRSQKSTMRLYARSSLLLGVAVTTFTLIVILCGDWLLRWLYVDTNYAGGGLVLSLLAFRLMFAIPTIAADHALVAMHAPRDSAIATLAGLITTIGCGVPLAEIYSVTGAAIGMLIGTAVESIVVLVFFRIRLRRWDWMEETE